jgi:hypothetical protein
MTLYSLLHASTRVFTYQYKTINQLARNILWSMASTCSWWMVKKYDGHVENLDFNNDDLSDAFKLWTLSVPST